MKLLADRHAGMPLWMAAGPLETPDRRSIWCAIDEALDIEPDVPCLTCDGLTVSRAGLRRAVDSMPWTRGRRRVGIAMSRSVSAVAATLAVWRNDGVYVPIAVEYPLLQLAAIAERCTLDLIVSDRVLQLADYRESGRHVGIDGVVMHLYERAGARAGAGHAPPGPADAELCYIAHTSGSSGAPKGVRISHAGLLNRIAAMRQLFEVGPGDRFLYKIPTLFDVHVWEFVLPLVSGCLLVIYRETTRFCLHAVAELIVEQRITLVGFAPTMLSVLLRNREFVAENALRLVICGGEAWAPQLARALHARMPHVRLFNSYGPTETTMVVTNWLVPDDPCLAEISLGHPQRNTVLVLEERERVLTANGLEVSGELLVGGVQVALGYVGPCDDDRFCERPIDGEMTRLYRTGDMVRLDPATGRLCFRGRIDNQVKINGVRIELDEVEAALRSVPLVESCVAFAVQAHDAVQLWAFFTTPGDREIAPDLVRAQCERYLSRFKMPAVMRHVQRLPLRHSGKIDRRAMMRIACGTVADAPMPALVA